MKDLHGLSCNLHYEAIVVSFIDPIVYSLEIAVLFQTHREQLL